jgi:seryl-tRNA synthetase
VLDLKYIRANADAVAENARLRRVECDVPKLVELAERKLAIVHELQEVQRRQNDTAKSIKSCKDQSERDIVIANGKRLKEQAAALETEQRELDAEIKREQSRVPNLTHPDSPRDKDVVLREVGERKAMSFKPKDHVDLCEKHRLADFEAAGRVTGADFYYMLGDGALLELALINYTMNKLVAAGFTPVITPDLARASVMEGTGYIPRGNETQIYSVADTDLCLIATAEITLAGMFADQILDADKLPLKFVGLSHCFRTESGAAGRATRGLFRVHQFTKVEMFAFCLPEQSEEIHQELLQHEEEIFKGLEVPFRVLDIAASDLGGPAYRKYDLEAWMPGRGDAGEWAEVTSTSNCTDYQARRLDVRFKRSGEKGTTHVHMLNGTAVACGRAIIALLENHQQEDGSIRLPTALQPWMMGKTKIG